MVGVQVADAGNECEVRAVMPPPSQGAQRPPLSGGINKSRHLFWQPIEYVHG